MPIIWDLFAVFFHILPWLPFGRRCLELVPSKANRSYAILPGLRWIGDSAACFFLYFFCDAKNQVTSNEKGDVLWNSKENSFPKKLIQVSFGGFGI